MLDGIRQRDWLSRRLRHRVDASKMFSLVDEPPICDDFNERILNRVSLREMLSHLPRRPRLLLQLYDLEGMSMEEVGQTLKVSESRISQLRRRTIEALRQRLTLSVNHPEDEPRLQPAQKTSPAPRAMARRRGSLSTAPADQEPSANGIASAPA